MSFLALCTKNLLNKNVSLNTRNLFLSSKLQIKEIKESQNGKELIISGEIKPSAREPYLLKTSHPHACPLCASNLDVKHTDIRIVSQFVRSDGCMLPRRITGLCKKQQKRMSSLVTMAQKAGLMPNLNPANSKKDPKTRYEWKKFNKYFDETTIKW
ncbi:39S ribosomal protein S18a, mitochondrial [Anoplophora glabripennis]|uniref:39S ribosomal protein S18a, mitochondrial n=1 Tax=Anoplophora glabripennis TaxID=217634 RepID=UPI0008753A9D|nr:39S ribosomal protein S18a, mitochondrial [Anoplophora glabripennis]